MAFSFLDIFLCFRDIYVFVYANKESDDGLGGHFSLL